jgi:hypothetical protein
VEARLTKLSLVLLMAMPIVTPSRRTVVTGAVIALMVVAILGVAYANYISSFNTMTTPGQVATNPLSPPTQTLMANTTLIGTTPVITAASIASAPDQNPAVYNNYASCASKHTNDTAQCYGELYQESSACVVLIVPVMDPNDNGVTVNQYYALHNLPTPHPSIGSWVTVTGQLLNGSSGSSNESCPSTYINVTQAS